MTDTVQIVTNPVEEPVSLDDLKGWLRLNSGSAEDNELARCIATAREMFTFHSNGRVVANTLFDQYAPKWPNACKPLQLLRGPVTEVVHVQYWDQDDELQTLDEGDYGVDLSGVPALVWMKDYVAWPLLSPHRPRPVVVRFQAGYGEDSGLEPCPEDIKLGILLLAAHYYRFRGDEPGDIPEGFLRLANKHSTGLINV